jgi:hypothetical protein
MRKRRAAKRKKGPQRPPKETTEKGFDFGERIGVMAVSDLEFNKALIDAGIVACGYGDGPVGGFPSPIPCLTLIGTNQAGLEAAFKHFKNWGCEEDGDVVDINMILKLDGTYEMRIGPEAERTMFRLIPQADLYRPFMSSVLYVKRFDSTHPMVRELMEYCNSPFSPVAVMGASADPQQKDFRSIQPIEGLPSLVKFELQIIEEDASGRDPRFYFRNKGRKPPREVSDRTVTPEGLCIARKKIFDVAFPVSRERIRRSGLVDHVRSLSTFADVSESQVVQAAINLALSDELISGDRYYSKIAKDLSEEIWKHVAKRFEFADGEPKPLDLDPPIITHQLELDVGHVLGRHGAPIAGQRFAKLQAHFRRKGYIDD